MADPKCAAINAAMKSAGLNYASLAAKVGSSEGRVTQICTGADKPTDQEFNALAGALGMKDVPHTGKHATQ